MVPTPSWDTSVIGITISATSLVTAISRSSASPSLTLVRWAAATDGDAGSRTHPSSSVISHPRYLAFIGERFWYYVTGRPARRIRYVRERSLRRSPLLRYPQLPPSVMPRAASHGVGLTRLR
jgi:hypothetical protein